MCETYGFAVVICMNEEGKFLAVKETNNRGWWLPAGAVDPGETFEEAAIRETMEEAGIAITLKGVLRVERSVGRDYARLRVIFFALPSFPNQKAKDFADSESDLGKWVTLEEYKTIGKHRGYELIEWAEYLLGGGLIFPLTCLTRERDAPMIGFPSKLSHFFPGKEKEKEQGNEEQLLQPPVLKDEKADLFRAVIAGDLEAVKNMILRGVDIETRTEKKWTPLLMAIKYEHISIIQYLLYKGADISSSSHFGRNALHFAAATRPQILQVLLSDPTSKRGFLACDDANDTPLHMAAKNGKEAFDLVQQALGPTVFQLALQMKNAQGQTPLELLRV